MCLLGASAQTLADSLNLVWHTDIDLDGTVERISLQPSIGTVTVRDDSEVVKFTLVAEQSWSYFGASLGIAGDADQDGIRDIFITAPADLNDEDRMGSVQVFCSRTGDPRWKYEAENGVWLTSFVKLIPDHTYDGVADLLVAAAPLDDMSSKFAIVLDATSGKDVCRVFVDPTQAYLAAVSGNSLCDIADVNNSGTVDDSDFSALLSNWVLQHPHGGDMDIDDDIDEQDAIKLLAVLEGVLQPGGGMFDLTERDGIVVGEPANDLCVMVTAEMIYYEDGDIDWEPGVGLTPDCLLSCDGCIEHVLEGNAERRAALELCRATAVCPPARLACVLALLWQVHEQYSGIQDCVTCFDCFALRPDGYPEDHDGSLDDPGIITPLDPEGCVTFNIFNLIKRGFVRNDPPLSPADRETIFSCRSNCITQFYTAREAARKVQEEFFSECMGRMPPDASPERRERWTKRCGASSRSHACMNVRTAIKEFASCWDGCTPNHPNDGFRN